MQTQLIDETEDDAWEATIRALGGHKKVSGWLWPHLKQETAYAKLKNCFREDKDEQLSWEDRKRILEAARSIGCHLAMSRLCHDLLYAAPIPANIEREKQELRGQLNIATERFEALVTRLERLENE
jgi:hypothetical protein